MQNLRSDAYNELKYKVIHFEYLPGQKISEKSVATALNLGRTPVREAIIRIEREGLIAVIPQSGTYITRIDMADAEDGRFVRECIEPNVTLNATANINNDQIAALEHVMDEQQNTAESVDYDKFFDLDQDFHHLFYQIAGQDTVWNWLQINNTQLNRFRRLRLKSSDLQWGTIFDQHRKILDAVKRRDLSDVHYLVIAHLHLMLKEKQNILGKFPDYFK